VQDFLGAFAKLQKATVGFIVSVSVSVCLSVRPSVCQYAWNNVTSTGRIFLKFIWIFRKNVQNIQDLFKSDKNNIYFT